MTSSHSAPDERPSLYERLGGYEAIHTFAAAALRKGFAHPVIGHYWQQMSESTFHKEHINFVDFLVVHWGGKANYRGGDRSGDQACDELCQFTCPRMFTYCSVGAPHCEHDDI